MLNKDLKKFANLLVNVILAFEKNIVLELFSLRVDSILG